jgi:hypothetical protein
VLAAAAALVALVGCADVDASSPATAPRDPCPKLWAYGDRFLAQAQAETELLPEGSAIMVMLEHYRELRADTVACHLAAPGEAK